MKMFSELKICDVILMSESMYVGSILTRRSLKSRIINGNFSVTHNQYLYMIITDLWSLQWCLIKLYLCGDIFFLRWSPMWNWSKYPVIWRLPLPPSSGLVWWVTQHPQASSSSPVIQCLIVHQNADSRHIVIHHINPDEKHRDSLWNIGC